MELRLVALGFWDIIENERHKLISAEKAKIEALVLADIRNAVDSSFKDYIAIIYNPQEAWNLLEAKFEQCSADSTNRLWNDFNIQQKNTESIRDYIACLQTIVVQLRTTGQTVDSNRIVDRLVHGLAAKYDDLKKNLRTCQLMEDQSEQILLQEKNLHSDEKSSDKNSSATASKTDSEGDSRRYHICE